MALNRLSEVDEDLSSNDDYDLYDAHEEEDEYNDDISSLHAEQPPIHPVPSMQAAFEESISEASETKREDGDPKTNAEFRRKELLDQEEFDDSWTTRWKQSKSAQCHPLLKLMAQIIFGMHLLHQEQAKSAPEVVNILQVHVDDIDGFLEKTTEDFDLAIHDIEERVSYLRLPMTHVEVFDIMLDDKKFRTQLIEGNEKIENIIARSAKAMNAALLDVQKGLNANQELAWYLDTVRDDWPRQSSEQTAIYVAMQGNEEGWKQCMTDLQMKGKRLGSALVKLGTVVGEMSRLAAAASRRDKVC